MNRIFVAVVVVMLCFGAGVLGHIFRMRLAADDELQKQVKLSQADAARIRAATVVPTENRVPRGNTFAAALEKFGLSHDDAANASAVAQRAGAVRLEYSKVL